MSTAFASSGLALAPAAAKPKWEGWYVGAHGAYAKSYSDNVLAREISGNGFGGGLVAGHQFIYDGYVLGAEADINFYDLTSDSDPFFGGKSAKDKLDAVAALRLKAGVTGELPWIGEALIYGSAGVAFGQWTASAQVPDPAQFVSSKDWRTALQFGVGAEMPLSDQLFLKTEVLHTDYEKETPISIITFVPTPISFDEKVTEARIGLTWRF